MKHTVLGWRCIKLINTEQANSIDVGISADNAGSSPPSVHHEILSYLPPTAISLVSAVISELKQREIENTETGIDTGETNYDRIVGESGSKINPQELYGTVYSARCSLFLALKTEPESPHGLFKSARFLKGKTGIEVIYPGRLSEVTPIYIGTIGLPSHVKLRMSFQSMYSLADHNRQPQINTKLAIEINDNGIYMPLISPLTRLSGAKFIKSMVS